MRIRSRLISGLAIALSVILSSSNVVLATDGSEMVDLEAEVLVEEEFVNPYVWSSDTFQVIHNVTDDWGTGYQCEITIINIGDTKIEDWNLTFESADVITDIWNASVISLEDGIYQLDNAGWNGDIQPQGSVSFGYVAGYEDKISVPDYYGISGTECELADEYYQITYQVSDVWEGGYTGNITLHNLSEEDLNNWKLSFALSDTITDLWNGTISGNVDGQYVIEYASYNAVIPAGGSVTIGFVAEGDTPQMYPENYEVKVVVHNEIKEEAKDDVIGIAYFKEVAPGDIRLEADGMQYAVNQLNLVGESGTTFEQIAALGEEYEFEIVGYIEFTNDYQIEFVSDMTYEELKLLREELEALDSICEVNLNLVSFMETNDETKQDTQPDIPGYQTSDVNWKDVWGTSYLFDTWGVQAINAPLAWEYQDRMSTVKIGVYDNMFFTHEDVDYKKIWNYEYMPEDHEYIEDGEHGTSVAGVMAADFDNGIGFAGVACKRELYAYAYSLNVDEISNHITSSVMEHKYALALMIGNGVRVINFSNGFEARLVYSAMWEAADRPEKTPATDFINAYLNSIETFLLRLIDRGYDFVIVQSAGNENDDFFVKDDSVYGYRRIKTDKKGNLLEPVDETAVIGNVYAKYNSFFAYSEVLRDRVIVVGSYGKDNVGNLHMSKFSNIGDRVDVVAPGEQIHSTIPYNKYDDELNGTSYSAPYVSGTVALVYSVNPDLTGPQVKQIIVDSATNRLSGIDSYQREENGIMFTIPEDTTEYSRVDACAAVEMTLGIEGDSKPETQATGFVMGNVSCEKSFGNDTEVLEGVTVTAYLEGADDTQAVSVTTDIDGNYSLSLQPGTYKIVMEMDGYASLEYNQVIVDEAQVEYLDNALLVKNGGLLAKIWGFIVDLFTGKAIEGAVISFRSGWNSWDSEIVDTVVMSNSEGRYEASLETGYYTAEIAKDGCVVEYVNIVVRSDGEIETVELEPVTQDEEMNIVLTWDKTGGAASVMICLYEGEECTDVIAYHGGTLTDSNGKVVGSVCNTVVGNQVRQVITINSTEISERYRIAVSISHPSMDLSNIDAELTLYYENQAPVHFSRPAVSWGGFWIVCDIENDVIISRNELI